MLNKKDECKPDVPPLLVTIALRDDIVQCTPDPVHVRQGQIIEWQCEGELPFAIHLGYDSPFDKVHHQAPRQQRIRIDIPNGIRQGRYKYLVAVYDGTNVWIEDPEIIIRGTGG